MNVQYVTFELGQHLLGIEILLVREIGQQVESTHVQLAPHYILGLANLRGQIVTLFDLAQRLGLASGAEASNEGHNIVLKSNPELALLRNRTRRDDLRTSDDPVGLRVQAVGDIIEVSSSDIQQLPANFSQLGGYFFKGVVPLEHRLLLVLNIEQVLKKN